MQMKKILIVDDAEINRDILKEIFRDEFAVYEAADGAEAELLIEKYGDELSLILLDLVMPEKSGIEVLMHMKETGMVNRVPVIVITGESTAESDEKVYEYGAADIIYKPFASRVVMRRSMNIIELYEQRNDMEKALERKTREVMEFQRKLERNNEFLINALSSVVEFRSLESGEHIQRVRSFSRIILEKWKEIHPECGFSDEDIELMVEASALHDIGKIGIPDKILLKPGKLTAEEFEIMKTHTTIGCDLLERFKQEDSDFYRYCRDICRYHHERYDGKGYPDGLVGDEIPIWAQIVSVVDVYDALVSPRVYKEPFPIDKAFDMIYDGECGAFSPKVLECLGAAREDIILETGKFEALENALSKDAVSKDA